MKITFLIVMLMVVVMAKAQLVITTIPLSTSSTVHFIDRIPVTQVYQDVFRTPILTTTVAPIVTTSSVIESPLVLYHISDCNTYSVPQPIVNNIVINNITVKDNSSINLVQFSSELHSILFK